MEPIKELEFREIGHVYTLNGAIIPSVSKIIEPVSATTYGSIPTSVLQKAADKGTAVHEAIERFNEIGIMDIEEELCGYTEAYVRWFESEKPEVLACEYRFYHKIMRYAGTADLIAIINGELWLVDYKTSYSLATKNYRLQMEAYVQALATQGIDIKGKLILHLKKDGSYETVKYPVKDAEAWVVFGSCKKIYDYCNAS